MLDYILDIQIQRREIGIGASRDVLLVDGSVGTSTTLLEKDWQLIWSGMRSNDDHEKFWLFARPSIAKPIHVLPHD